MVRTAKAQTRRRVEPAFTLAELCVAAQPVFAHGRMPARTFFTPTDAFFLAMDRRRGTPIWDVGAGGGHVFAALLARGHRAAGIDLAHRTGGDPRVMLANGASFPYQEGCVALLCRPCHGPFVSAVVTQAARCRAREAIYVGHAEHVEDDLGRWYKWAAVEGDGVGEEGESMWTIDLVEVRHQGRTWLRVGSL